MSHRLSTNAAAIYLGVPAPTLRQYRARHIGPVSYKLGGRVFYDVSDLDAWVEHQKATTASPDPAAVTR